MEIPKACRTPPGVDGLEHKAAWEAQAIRALQQQERSAAALVARRERTLEQVLPAGALLVRVPAERARVATKPAAKPAPGAARKAVLAREATSNFWHDRTKRRERHILRSLRYSPDID